MEKLFEIGTHQHVARFLLLKHTKDDCVNNGSLVQMVTDGSVLTEDSIQSGQISIYRPIVVTDVPESLGMKVDIRGCEKQSTNNAVDVLSSVIEDVGEDVTVAVIDVKTQQEFPTSFSFSSLYMFFNNKQRLQLSQRWQNNLKEIERKISNETNQAYSTTVVASGCNNRKTSKKIIDATTIEGFDLTHVINQVSFEFSRSELSKKVLSPSFVRDIDWIDNAWNESVRKIDMNYPKVQYYFLLSSTGSYMDFHIDFGGTSVWYSVLKGQKEFCLIRPTKEVLEVYKEWDKNNGKNNSMFLPDLLLQRIDKSLLKDVFVFMTLKEKQTAILPSGWIHCVFTPVDSVVIGGNFLHGYDINMQCLVSNIELRTGTKARFRFPGFSTINIYALGLYYKKMVEGDIISQKIMEQLPLLINSFESRSKLKNARDQKAIQFVLTNCGFRRDTISCFLHSAREMVQKFLGTNDNNMNEQNNDDNMTNSEPTAGCNDDIDNNIDIEHATGLDDIAMNDREVDDETSGPDAVVLEDSIATSSQSLLFDDYYDKKKIVASCACMLFVLAMQKKKYQVQGRLPNRTMVDVTYESVMERVNNLKHNYPEQFTRMYRLPPAAFDKTLSLIHEVMSPKKTGGTNFIPPMIKLCVALRFLAGGSYLDLSFGYLIPRNVIHSYIWEVLEAIDCSPDPFLNNIISPTQMTSNELEILEEGFSSLTNGLLRGTVAAGDGVIFRMIQPTNEEVGGDVASYYTRKQYFAYGMQAFCDSRCKFLMISSKMSSSTNDNVAYTVSQLSKDIKAGKLPNKYHVVFDEAYPCTEQEMAPWRGRNLTPEKDACNYFLSLNRQVIERAFGILVQRWGIFWRPLRVAMSKRQIIVRVACKLHNVCIDAFGLNSRIQTVRRGTIVGFHRETDNNESVDVSSILDFDRYDEIFCNNRTSRRGVGQGRRTDLETCNHRDLDRNHQSIRSCSS